MPYGAEPSPPCPGRTGGEEAAALQRLCRRASTGKEPAAARWYRQEGNRRFGRGCYGDAALLYSQVRGSGGPLSWCLGSSHVPAVPPLQYLGSPRAPLNPLVFGVPSHPSLPPGVWGPLMSLLFPPPQYLGSPHIPHPPLVFGVPSHPIPAPWYLASPHTPALSLPGIWGPLTSPLCPPPLYLGSPHVVSPLYLGSPHPAV